jgi:hypothetical protein
VFAGAGRCARDCNISVLGTKRKMLLALGSIYLHKPIAFGSIYLHKPTNTRGIKLIGPYM